MSTRSGKKFKEVKSSSREEKPVTRRKSSNHLQSKNDDPEDATSHDNKKVTHHTPKRTQENLSSSKSRKRRSMEKEEVLTPSAEKMKSTRKSSVGKKQLYQKKILDENATKSSGDSSSFYGYEKEVKLLRSLMKSSLDDVESNSVLICGPRGSGKTSLVEKCLLEESGCMRGLIIRLDGFVDGDEWAAFRSISLQSEFEGAAAGIPQLMQHLMEESNRSSKKPVVIIMDEFDVFCKRNQTLLYNLFDLSQKCRHLCIVGMTTRLDSLELLEKRVKSRMNQTIIYLSSPFVSFDDYMSFASSLLKGYDQNEKNSSLIMTQEEVNSRLKDLYSSNKSIRDMKKHLMMIQEELASTKAVSTYHPENNKNSIIGKDDSSVEYICSLSHLEFALLMMASKYCRIRDVEQFTCHAVIEMSSSLPSQMGVTREFVFKVINDLLDYGLFVKISGSRSETYLNEWTQLCINLHATHLKDALQLMQKTLPYKLKALLTAS